MRYDSNNILYIKCQNWDSVIQGAPVIFINIQLIFHFTFRLEGNTCTPTAVIV